MCFVFVRTLCNYPGVLKEAIGIPVAIVTAIHHSFHTWRKLQLLKREVIATLTGQF